MATKIRKKTLKKAKPVLKAARMLGEFLGEAAVIGRKKTKKAARRAGSAIGTTAITVKEKSRELAKVTKEVVPEVVREIRKGFKTGTVRAKKKR